MDGGNMGWRTLLGMLAGCGVADSEDIATSGLTIGVGAVADGRGSTGVDVQFQASVDLGGKKVELSSGDSLYLRYGTSEVEFQESAGLLGPLYHADVGTDEAGTEVAVALLRRDQDSAENTTFTIPAPFEMTAPADGVELSRAEPFSITWVPSGEPDPMHYVVESPCTEIVGGDVVDDGGPIVVEGLLVAKDHDPKEACEAKVTLSRGHQGEVDPALDGGGVSVAHAREVLVSLTP
jgi:hypothetical protein